MLALLSVLFKLKSMYVRIYIAGMLVGIHNKIKVISFFPQVLPVFKKLKLFDPFSKASMFLWTVLSKLDPEVHLTKIGT